MPVLATSSDSFSSLIVLLVLLLVIRTLTIQHSTGMSGIWSVASRKCNSHFVQQYTERWHFFTHLLLVVPRCLCLTICLHDTNTYALWIKTIFGIPFIFCGSIFDAARSPSSLHRCLYYSKITQVSHHRNVSLCFYLCICAHLSGWMGVCVCVASSNKWSNGNLCGASGMEETTTEYEQLWDATSIYSGNVYALGIKSRINFVENLHYKVYWFLCVTSAANTHTQTLTIRSFAICKPKQFCILFGSVRQETCRHTYQHVATSHIICTYATCRG